MRGSAAHGGVVSLRSRRARRSGRARAPGTVPAVSIRLRPCPRLGQHALAGRPRPKGCREGGRRAAGAGSHWGDGLQHRRWRLPCANVEKKRALWPLPPPPTQPHARAPHHHPSARPACRPPPLPPPKMHTQKGQRTPGRHVHVVQGRLLEGGVRRVRAQGQAGDRAQGPPRGGGRGGQADGGGGRPGQEGGRGAAHCVCLACGGGDRGRRGKKNSSLLSDPLRACRRPPPIFHSPPHSRPRSHPTPHAPRPLPARPPTHPPPCPWNRRAAAACQTHATTTRPRTRRTRRRRTPPRAVGQSWSPSPSRPRRPARGRRPGPSGGRCPAPWASNCSGRRRCS
jgi:hypothetical protein